MYDTNSYIFFASWTNGAHFLLQVEVKPYVLDDQMCDECQGTRCGGKFAPFFCANVTCLQYYCEYCWASIHSRAGREFHKPLVKEGGDRPRHVPFRWSWSLGLNPAASTGADEIEGRRECCLRAFSVLEICAFILDFNEEMGLFNYDYYYYLQSHYWTLCPV